jgi:hypothetical protein
MNPVTFSLSDLFEAQAVTIRNRFDLDNDMGIFTTEGNLTNL